MTKFVRGGPPRYQHQKAGLAALIRNGGKGALLFDPGTGKTATTIDYMSLLALKVPSREARVLVVCPLAAVDTWVLQMSTYASPQIDYWTEVLGGSLKERAQALASRGGNPMRGTASIKKAQPHGPRAMHWNRAVMWDARAEGAATPVSHREGPDCIGMPHTGRPRLIVEVLNLDTFSSRDRVGAGTMADYLLDAVRRYGPDLVVIDESHKIKGHASNVSRLLGRIGEKVPRRIILTGTVMPAGPLDVFGQWRFLDPYAFGTRLADGSTRRATFPAFRERFARMGGYMGRQVVGYKNLDDLQDVMAQLAVVARKEDVLDLPPVTETVVPVHLSAAETRAYDDMKAGLAAALDDGSLAVAPNALSQMMKLRQITSGHVPNAVGGVSEIGDSKVRVIDSIVNDTLAGEKRVVVFCYFSAEIRMLQRTLARSGTEVLVIEGSTPHDRRLAIRQRFGSDEDARMVLLAQVTTLNMSVNELVTASHAVFGSLSQRRDDLEQAKARLDRNGQTRPVTFWYALAPKTVDEVIMRAHRDRTSLEEAMLQHIKGEEDESEDVPTLAQAVGR